MEFTGILVRLALATLPLLILIMWALWPHGDALDTPLSDEWTSRDGKR